MTIPRGPKAQRLHAIGSSYAHGHDEDCRCRFGRRMDDALQEAYDMGVRDGMKIARHPLGISRVELERERVP